MIARALRHAKELVAAQRRRDGDDDDRGIPGNEGGDRGDGDIHCADPDASSQVLTLIAIVYLLLLVDLAEATVTLLEVEQGAKKLVAVEIGPEHVGDVELGVQKLPEEEV